MDKQQADEITKLLNDLTDKTNDMTVFTEEQSKTLLELATFWNQVKAVVSLGASLGNGLKWVVVIVATYAALKSGIVDFIKTTVAK